MDLPKPRAAPEDSSPDAGAHDCDLVTVAEVAGLLRVSKMTAYRFVHANALPVTRIGKTYWIRCRDLTEFLRTNQLRVVEPGLDLERDRARRNLAR